MPSAKWATIQLPSGDLLTNSELKNMLERPGERWEWLEETVLCYQVGWESVVNFKTLPWLSKSKVTPGALSGCSVYHDTTPYWMFLSNEHQLLQSCFLIMSNEQGHWFRKPPPSPVLDVTRAATAAAAVLGIQTKGQPTLLGHVHLELLPFLPYSGTQ